MKFVHCCLKQSTKSLHNIYSCRKKTLLLIMAYVYFTSYALNKSATKHVAIALEVPKHSTRIILAKTMDKLEISLTPEEFKKFTEFIPTMTLLLRQDVASLQPEYISETLRVQVISIFDGKQVLLERVNEKMEVINSLYYCLGT